jgi:hypothetical protein
MAAAVSEKDAVAIARAVVAKAEKGDMIAARLVMDRLWPVGRGRAVNLDLPGVTDAAGVKTAHMNLLKSVADGSLTLEEAQTVSELLALQLKTIVEGDASSPPPVGPGVGPPPPSVIIMYGEPDPDDVEYDGPAAGWQTANRHTEPNGPPDS